MERYFTFVRNVSKVFNWIGGILLILMMLVNVVDVVLRGFGTGIVGTYELATVAGALIVGLAIAKNSVDNAHISVNILTEKVSKNLASIFLICTKLIGCLIFGLLVWSFVLKGNDLYVSREVSLTLHIPVYPIAVGLSFCFFLEFLVLLSDMLRAITGWRHE